MHKSGTATAQVTAAEPPRIKKFRRDLIKAIPRAPNNKASLQHMEGKHLTDLLIDYINWRSRYVGERPAPFQSSQPPKPIRAGRLMLPPSNPSSNR
jgi:hypothetical protein